jgi:glutathione S-transferase
MFISSFTAADCVLGFTLWWAYTLDNGSLLREHPILMDYLQRLRDRPAFQKTFGTDPENWDWSRYFSTYVRGVQDYGD